MRSQRASPHAQPSFTSTSNEPDTLRFRVSLRLRRDPRKPAWDKVSR